MKSFFRAALLLGSLAFASPASDEVVSVEELDTSSVAATWKNPKASVNARVKDLVGRMDLNEKMAQLMQGDIRNWMDSNTGAFSSPSGLAANMAEKAGSFYVYAELPVTWEDVANNIEIGQTYLKNNTRWGIPAFVQTEGIHGFLLSNATIFNSPIGYSCSFNPTLIQQMAEIIGQESIAIGVNQLFAPLGDLARELRYGRVEECFSEDPYLAGEVAYSYVTGLQSQNVSATVKHFAAYGSPEQGLNTGPVHGGERELRSVYLPSYKRAIIDAGAYSIMAAYSSYDGIALVANEHILTDILRGEWGYQYWVTSDAGATDRLWSPFQVCDVQNAACVTSNALTAGTDIEMGGGSFNYRAIPAMVQNGTLKESVVNQAVSRILRAKFAMGLFDKSNAPLPQEDFNKVIHTPANIKLARQVDAESIVLLQNPAQILPLKTDQKVAVIGPMGGFMNYGDYVVYQSQYHGVTPFAGMSAAADNPSLVTYAQGCERWSSDESMIPDAVAAAEAADVAVVVVGTWSRDQGELWTGLNATTGESVDVDDLSLVGAMRPLVQAIVNTGKPTVIVFSSGKPITEPWISNTTASLVQQFYPSEQGGNALADVLYGAYNPSGKLSVSFPYSVGDLPIYYDYLNSARQVWDTGFADGSGGLHFGRQYVLGNPEPWFPFGFGLSYTTFTYGPVTLSKTQASATDTITATQQVTNTGSLDGDVVVQLYVKDLLASVDVPNKSLKGFNKVTIKAGQSKAVSVEVNVADLGLWNVNMDYVVEPGQFIIYMGSSSQISDLTNFATLNVS